MTSPIPRLHPLNACSMHEEPGILYHVLKSNEYSCKGCVEFKTNHSNIYPSLHYMYISQQESATGTQPLHQVHTYVSMFKVIYNIILSLSPHP